MNIGWIGCGRLGKAVCVTIDYMGHTVYAYDKNPAVLNHDTVGAIENDPFGSGSLDAYLKRGTIVFSSMQEVVDKSDIIFVAVQTPHDDKFDGTKRLTRERADFDYNYLISAITELASCNYSKDKVVAIISTVLPGTIRTHIKPLLNKNMKLVYNPYFITQTTVAYDFLNPEFVLLGVDDKIAVDKVKEFYRSIHSKPVIEMSIESAELTKVAYNLFITMKINYANTIGQVCCSSGADINTVMGALKHANTRLVSGKYLDMGMPDSGGCHPRDALAMSHFVKNSCPDVYDLFEDAMKCREGYIDWLVSVIQDEIPPSMDVMVLGKAFKPECSVIAGSSSILLYNCLVERFICNVSIYDPYVHKFGFETVLDKPKCYVIGTKHACFKRYKFPQGSVVIDPHRYIPDIEGVKVIRLGENKDYNNM